MYSIKEQLDFSFSFKDFESVDEFEREYLNDRIKYFTKYFIDNIPTQNEYENYINFFITPIFDDKEQHPYLYRIQHFLERDYEFFTLPEVFSIKENLLKILNIDSNQLEQIDSFINFEFNNINDMADLWEELYNKIQEYPILMLNTFDFMDINGTKIYFEDNTDPFIKENFITFITNISELFPNELSKLGNWIICNPKYIEFSAGKGTFAFYMRDNVFVRSKVEEEDKKFYIETLYHEFFHFLFELLPEYVQIAWYDMYEIWKYKNVKMTRDEGKNSVEELFADVGSLLCTPIHDFIQEPNPIIRDYVKIILKDNFNITFI